MCACLGNTEERAGKRFKSSGWCTEKKITSKDEQINASILRQSRLRVAVVDPVDTVTDMDKRQATIYDDQEKKCDGSHWPQGSRVFLV